MLVQVQPRAQEAKIDKRAKMSIILHICIVRVLGRLDDPRPERATAAVMKWYQEQRPRTERHKSKCPQRAHKKPA